MTFAAFLTDVASVFATIKLGIGVFMEPPLLWYVVIGFAAAAIGIAKSLVPKKKAK